tara:strand:- start:1115 stop:2380 length:1266 start_codon:yes stop_codon:yes gene_type:complete
MSNKLEKLIDQLVKLHPKYIDLSLDRLKILLKKLGNPENNLPPVIHVAGTNGKGSTISYIKNILEQHNYNVHCYISPHLESFEERFIICNKQVKRKKLINTLEYIKKINGKNKITFFEITTAAAFFLFSKEKADFTILETGLGGRLDATNVVKKTIIDIITPIGIDHQEYLGETIEKITKEKLGIIKEESTVIIGKQKTYVKNYIKHKIKKFKNKKLFFNENFKIINKNDNFFVFSYKNKKSLINKPKLLGKHQLDNAATAVMAIMQIKNLNYKIKNSLINKGLNKTYWPGRLEKGVLNKIPVFLDGAHNISGAEQLSKFFSKGSKKRWVIFGMLKNKDIINFLLTIKNVIDGVIAINIPKEKNSFSTSEIKKICKKLNISCIERKNIIEANNYLINTIEPKEILVTGSLYLIGKVRKLYV